MRRRGTVNGSSNVRPVMSNPNQTPAGWYSDDSGFDRKRFWDGQQWTDQYAYRDRSENPALDQSVETVIPAGTPGMIFTRQLAWVMGGLAAAVQLLAGFDGGREPNVSILVDMAIGFVTLFGIVLFLGWVIGRLRVLLSGNKSSATLTPGPSTPVAPLPTPAPVVEDDGATVEAPLRRLKALHDDGILTDEEYETKRQQLAEQL